MRKAVAAHENLCK